MVLYHESPGRLGPGSSFCGRCSGGCPQTPALPVLKSHSPAAECQWWWWTQSCPRSPGSLPSAQGSCLIQRHGAVLMTHPHPAKAWTPRPIRDNSPGSSIPVLKPCESAGVTAHILHPSPTLAFTLWTKKSAQPKNWELRFTWQANLSI